MGEYVKIKGQRDEVKLGTCEDMYYCTWKQGQQIKHKCSGDMAAKDFDSFDTFRWRFPFPDEVDVPVGSYSNFNRGFLMYAPKSIIEIGHTKIFIRTDHLNIIKEAPAIGFKVPCPVQDAANIPVYVWDSRQTAGNVFFEVIQQKPVITEEGKKELQTVVRCPYCGECCRMSKDEVIKLSKWAGSNPVDDSWRPIIEIMLAGYSQFEGEA